MRIFLGLFFLAFSSLAIAKGPMIPGGAYVLETNVTHSGTMTNRPALVFTEDYFVGSTGSKPILFKGTGSETQLTVSGVIGFDTLMGVWKVPLTSTRGTQYVLFVGIRDSSHRILKDESGLQLRATYRP